MEVVVIVGFEQGVGRAVARLPTVGRPVRDGIRAAAFPSVGGRGCFNAQYRGGTFETAILELVTSPRGRRAVRWSNSRKVDSRRNGIPMDPIDLAWAERRAGLELEIERLTRLVADLKVFCVAKEPTDAQLAEAPVIERWRVTSKPAYCLVGEVSGHPLLAGSGRRVVTSDLVLIDGVRSWARTRSRWYRLGTHIKSAPGG